MSPRTSFVKKVVFFILVTGEHESHFLCFFIFYFVLAADPQLRMEGLLSEQKLLIEH